jgi:hypothetical protein
MLVGWAHQGDYAQNQHPDVERNDSRDRHDDQKMLRMLDSHTNSSATMSLKHYSRATIADSAI